MPTAAGSLGMRVELKKQEVAPQLEVGESWQEYLRDLDRKKRHELRRKMRRVNEELKPQFEVTGSYSKDVIDALVELIRKSSPQKREFMSERMEAFFREMIRTLFTTGVAEIYTLKSSGNQVAAVLGLEFGKRLYLYNGGYDPAVKLPTGVAISGKIIEYAISKRCEQVDFLRGGERFKYDLGAKDLQLYQLTIKK